MADEIPKPKRPDNFRQASRADYFTGKPSVMGAQYYNYDPTTDQLKIGALQRLADAVEQLNLAADASRWIPVTVALPAPMPNSILSAAVLAVEHTGSQVVVSYDHRTGTWKGLDYQPRITHWEPLRANPKQEQDTL